MKTTMGMLLLVGGLLAGLTGTVGGVASILGYGDAMQRVTNHGTVQLNEPGTYTVFYEQQSVVDGQPFRASGDRFKVGIQNASTQEWLDIAPLKAQQTYTIGPHQGSATGTIEVEEPGAYTVVGEHHDGSPIVFAIAPSMGASFGRTFALIGLGVFGFGAGFLGLLVTLAAATRRRRSALA